MSQDLTQSDADTIREIGKLCTYLAQSNQFTRALESARNHVTDGEYSFALERLRDARMSLGVLRQEVGEDGIDGVVDSSTLTGLNQTVGDAIKSLEEGMSKIGGMLAGYVPQICTLIKEGNFDTPYELASQLTQELET